MTFWLKIANVLSWIWRLLLIGWMIYLVFNNELKATFIMLFVYLILSMIDKGK